MIKNHVPEVAKILGVEPGEEFQISGKPKDNRFFISDEGLKLRYGGKEYYAQSLLPELLTGKAEIVRRPWRPKQDEKYWSVATYSDGDFDVVMNGYSGHSFDINNILMGNCFLTREAAEAAAPDIVRFYQDVRKMEEQ